MAQETVRMLPQEYDPAVPLDQLTPHPANPNEGDIGLLSELLDENGFAGAVLAQKSTGILIDGETRWRTAHAKNQPTLPVLWVDVDDDTRDNLLAEYNESTRRGRNNEQKLYDFLNGLANRPRGLTGTAFNGDDLDSLRARLHAPLVIDNAPTGAEYAETDEEHERRAEAVSGYGDRKQGGALIEMILVFTAEAREEVGRLMDNIRAQIGDKEARASDLVLTALRVHREVLAGDLETAVTLARPEPLGGTDG